MAPGEGESIDESGRVIPCRYRPDRSSGELLIRLCRPRRRGFPRERPHHHRIVLLIRQRAEEPPLAPALEVGLEAAAVAPGFGLYLRGVEAAFLQEIAQALRGPARAINR